MKTLLLALFVPLLAVFAGSTNGLAQTPQDPCAAESRLKTDTLYAWGVALNDVVNSQSRMDRAYMGVLSVTHQLSVLRARISNINSLLIFVPDPSPLKIQLDAMRNGYEDQVKAITPQQIKARAELLASFDDWTKKSDLVVIAEQRADQAFDRWTACTAANTPRPSANPRPVAPPPAARGSVRYVNVTTDPVSLKPPGGWGWSPDGGSMTFTHPSSGQQTFKWTDPPKQIGPEGAEITLTVSSKSNPNGVATAGLSVKGDFLVEPAGAHVEVRSEKEQFVEKTLTVRVKPPPGFSGTALKLIFGADYGPISFIYNYEVIR